MKRYRQDEQEPPAVRPVVDGVVMRYADIYEVDPKLMKTHFRQQRMPAWDTERIVSSRTDYLDWVHNHFADETVYYGSPSELDDEGD